MKRTKAIMAERRKAAEERAAAWRALTPQAQIAALDRRLGPGKGARRQRAHILKARAAA